MAALMLYAGRSKAWSAACPWRGCCFLRPQIGAIMLPLMIFHQLQLMVCASIARRQGSVHDPDSA